MIGRTVSHYTILEIINTTGLSVLYKARDTKLQRYAALKFLPPHLVINSEIKDRFIAEARAASALDHPNICTIYEINETSSGQIYIAMAWYDGHTLQSLLELQTKEGASQTRLPISQLWDFSAQIAKGLSQAHKQGIIHRDIKPSNIMITEEGLVKILDFGLAKLAGQNRITKMGYTLGTVVYMSPEQVMGTLIDKRSDVWSLGVMMYEIAAGQVPFKGEVDQAIMYNIVNTEPVPIEHLAPAIPAELQYVINTALKKELDSRLPNMEAVVNALAADKHERLKRAGFFDKKGKTSRRFMFAVVLAIFSLICLLMYFVFKFDSDKKRFSPIPIIVTDILNRTSDQDLNSLSGLLISSLQQSNYLGVLSHSQMYDVMKKQKKEYGEFLDEEAGRDLCRQTKTNILIVPEISKRMQKYIFKCSIYDLRKETKPVILQQEAPDKQSIFSAIDVLAETIRKSMIAPKSEKAEKSAQLASITTQNLEAYGNYFLGEEMLNRMQFVASRAAFLKAVKLDSTFGLAYYRLAYISWWLEGNEQLQHELLQKAAACKIPDREQRLVLAHTVAIEKGNLQGIEILHNAEKRYPQDKEILFNIGYWAYQLGDNEQAAQYLEKVLQMDPYFVRAIERLILTYENLGADSRMQKYLNIYKCHNANASLRMQGWHYFRKGDYRNALMIFSQDFERDMNSPEAMQGLLLTFFALDDKKSSLKYACLFGRVAFSDYAFSLISSIFASADEFEQGLSLFQRWNTEFPQYATAINSGLADLLMYQERYREAQDILLPLSGIDQPGQLRQIAMEKLYCVYLYQGQYRKAAQICTQLSALHQEAHLIASAASASIRLSLLSIWSGNSYLSKADAGSQEIFDNDISWPPYWELSYYKSILKGDMERARAIQQKFIRNIMPSILKPLELAAQQNCTRARAAADSVLHPRRPFYYLAEPYPVLVFYHLGLCAYQAGDWNQAELCLQSFQKIYQNKSGYRGVYYPKSVFLLARIADLKGQTGQAVSRYQKFLQLWQNADDDLVERHQAVARIAALTGSQ